ncbi:transducer of ERBB2 [Gaertneriomyces sp. JEL0708]|nr:transducer of ERBB2 [Gaertneriomyces sp. JEL0708]
MLAKFQGHWDYKKPFRGNAYRALCILCGVVDNLILDSCRAAGIDPSDLNLPSDLVLWTDPHSVTYRIGDFAPITTVWENKAALDTLEHDSNVELPSFFRGRSPTPPSTASHGSPGSPSPKQILGREWNGLVKPTILAN